jgi:hypothetical protein
MSEKLNERDRSVIALYKRSPQDLDGWATVSRVVLPLVRSSKDELFEVDEAALRVRLTPLGETLAKYL